MNLVPSWKPCEQIDHLISLNVKSTHVSHYKGSQTAQHKQNSEKSYQIVAEAVGPPSSSETSCLVSKQNLDHANFDEVLSHASVGDQSSTTKPDDVCSEMSYVSITSEFNDRKLSVASFLSIESGFTGFNLSRVNNGSQSSFAFEIEASFDHWGKVSDMGINVMLSFSRLNNLSFMSDPEDELRLELEMIEHQYQEAIKEISRRRSLAIMETRRRLSHKKMPSSSS